MPIYYNKRNIRDLLSHGFGEGTLRMFVVSTPEFGDFYAELPGYASKSMLVNKLVAYADDEDYMHLVLAWAEASNPEAYERYGPYTTDNPPLIGPKWAMVGAGYVAAFFLMVAVLAIFAWPTDFAYQVQVVDRDTGQPVPNADVLIYSGERLMLRGITGTDGVATIDIAFEDLGGNVTIYADAPGYDYSARYVTRLLEIELPESIGVSKSQ